MEIYLEQFQRYSHLRCDRSLQIIKFFKHKVEFFWHFLFQDSLLKKAVIDSVATQAGLKQFVNRFRWLLMSSILINRFRFKFPSITSTSQIPATFMKPWCSGLKKLERTILQFV